MSTRPNMEARPANAAAAPLVSAGMNVAIVALVAGWLVPGAGHFVMKRWTRGIFLLVAITLMFVLGLQMEGKIYSPNTGDILDILGFVGDLGCGGLYFASRILNLGMGAVQLATADYGTKYIIVAGLLNVIAAVDAHNIALGKKR